MPGGEVAKGPPGRDRVGERDPHPSVHIAPGMEVSLVNAEAALNLLVVDPHHLDAEVPRKASADGPAERLWSD